MKRVYILLLDSFGIGASSDANKFGDFGANTLGHIAEFCYRGKANQGRIGSIKLPNMTKLGLSKAAAHSAGIFPLGMEKNIKIIGGYAYASEISSGKDTTSGHWEITGVPVLFEWDYFLNKKNSFPESILKKLISKANLPGYLGNCHSSGTVILKKFGSEHISTNKPILYTSSDSVFQITCHEETFGLEQLYRLCQITRNILSESRYNISRVIARPFFGNNEKNFFRTDNRHDFSVEPPYPTVLKKLIDEKSGTVISIGKVADIYAKVGISKIVKATGINSLFDATLHEMKMSGDNTIIFTNFVDFDSYYGHRRDVSGYATALELFDLRLPEIMLKIKENDILIITADHGCDPTWHGTNHTRENIPILMYGSKIRPRFYGHRKTFADIGQTIAKYFNLSPMKYGKALL